MQQHSGQHLLSAVLEKQYDTQVSQAEVTQHTRTATGQLPLLLPDSVLVDGGTHRGQGGRVLHRGGQGGERGGPGRGAGALQRGDQSRTPRHRQHLRGGGPGAGPGASRHVYCRVSHSCHVPRPTRGGCPATTWARCAWSPSPAWTRTSAAAPTWPPPASCRCCTSWGSSPRYRM